MSALPAALSLSSHNAVLIGRKAIEVYREGAPGPTN